MWCSMNQSQRIRPTKKVRTSVGFSRDQFELLERIATEKQVSVAWVVREAVRDYIIERWPLLTHEAARQPISRARSDNGK